ncbi:MAG: hypothetical protein U5L06_12550 [Rhodovibrio sp.]|nr:hypothetical protein [Rhodovibrio sp.]
MLELLPGLRCGPTLHEAIADRCRQFAGNLSLLVGSCLGQPNRRRARRPVGVRVVYAKLCLRQRADALSSMAVAMVLGSHARTAQ